MFKNWVEDNIIGHKTIEEGGRNTQYLLLTNCVRKLIQYIYII